MKKLYRYKTLKELVADFGDGVKIKAQKGMLHNGNIEPVVYVGKEAAYCEHFGKEIEKWEFISKDWADVFIKEVD